MGNHPSPLIEILNAGKITVLINFCIDVMRFPKISTLPHYINQKHIPKSMHKFKNLYIDRINLDR